MMTDNAGHRLVWPGNRRTEKLDPWYDMPQLWQALCRWRDNSTV